MNTSTTIRYKNRSKLITNQSGSVLYIAVIGMIIMSLVGFVALRNSNLFNRVIANFRVKTADVKVAEVGITRAFQEVGRRWSKVRNNDGTTPQTNGQYLWMLYNDLTSMDQPMRRYAEHLINISQAGCTESVTGGTNYGSDVDDIPVCIDEDLGGSYDYQVELVNEAGLIECRDNGFLSNECGTDGYTRTIAQPCVDDNLANHVWTDPTCFQPSSLQYGDLGSPPVAGYRLHFRSTSGNATIDGEITVFVEPSEGIGLATQARMLPAELFEQGAFYNGQIRLMLDNDTMVNKFWDYFPPGISAPYYNLGRPLAYSALFAISSPTDKLNPWINPALYGGFFAPEVLTNGGIEPGLAAQVAAALPYANPEQLGQYDVVAGSGYGIPMNIDNGAFDRNDVLNKINEYDSAASLTASATGCIQVSNGVQDSFTTATTITNNLTGREERSVLLLSQNAAGAPCNYTLNGPVLIDGDLALGSGDIMFTGQTRGAFFVRRNTMVMGNIRTTNFPMTGIQDLATSTVSTPYSLKAACAGLGGCEAISILSGGNTTYGAPFDGNWMGAAATLLSRSQTYVNLPVTPLDGLGPDPTTGYGATPTPHAGRHTLTTDPQFGGNYDELLQIGFTNGKNTSAFNPGLPVEHREPWKTGAPGLWPEGANSAYRDVPLTPTRFLFHWLRQPVAQYLPAYGLIRRADEYVVGPGNTDGYGRAFTGTARQACGGETCSPPAQLNGGPLNWGGGWGPNAWISPQALFHVFHSQRLYSAGTTLCTSTSCNTPAINENTFDTVTGQVRDSGTGNPAIDINTGSPFAAANSFMSRTTEIRATLVTAGTHFGWLGTGAGPLGTPPIFYNGVGPLPDLTDLDTPYLDRRDTDTAFCPNRTDCNGNGATFVGGMVGDALLINQGATHVYSSDLFPLIKEDMRKAVLTRFEIQ